MAAVSNSTVLIENSARSQFLLKLYHMSGVSLTTGYQAILRTILPAWLRSYFSWLEGSKKVDECGDNGCEFGGSGESDEISSSSLARRTLYS